MQLLGLPSHLVGRILDNLDSRERATLSLVSRAWREVSELNWSAIKLSFQTLRELELLRSWLETFAARGNVGCVREFELYWQGGKPLYPATCTFGLEAFTCIETLRLTPPVASHWAMNSKVVEGLAPLKRLKVLELAFFPSNTWQQELVTLEEFAPFEKLQDLNVTVVAPRVEILWGFVFSPKLGALTDLRRLTIAGISYFQVTPVAQAIAARLQHFDLRALRCPAQPMDMPKVESLVTHNCPLERFPFRQLHALRSLHANNGGFPADMTPFASLERLTLGTLAPINGRLAAGFAPLLQLRELFIQWYEADKVETFEALAGLQRLQKLSVRLDSTEQKLLRPVLSQLPDLRELRICAYNPSRFTIDDDFARYRALESLTIATLDFLAPISSPCLRSLTLSPDCSTPPAAPPKLGALPKLESLSLSFSMDAEDAAACAASFAELPRLRRLCLTKHYGNNSRDGTRSPRDTAIVERMLHSLRRLQALEVLQVVAVNESIGLSRRIMPSVSHFALACNGLAVCRTCMPWIPASVELLYRTASWPTTDLLEHNAEVSPARLRSVPVHQARYPWGAEGPVRFRDDVYDDGEWGSLLF